MSSLPVNPLPTLNTEQFRQKLAGLVDPKANVTLVEIASVKTLAVHFVAALPEVFGESLDRLTLWDKIGSALEAAHAKTAAGDTDFFISKVAESLQSNPASFAANQSIAEVMLALDGEPDEIRCQWMSYIFTHRFALLVRARAAWEQTKASRKEAASHE